MLRIRQQRNLQLASRRSIKGAELLKYLVKRPSTRRRLRDVKRSIDHLLNDLTNEFTRGQDLIRVSRQEIYFA